MIFLFIASCALVVGHTLVLLLLPKEEKLITLAKSEGVKILLFTSVTIGLVLIQLLLIGLNIGVWKWAVAL